jgi:hypothetical protein
MSTIDMSKSVWKVIGHLPAPDGRRYTCFLNAESKHDAIEKAEADEGIVSIDSVYQIDATTGLKLVPIAIKDVGGRTMTAEEILNEIDAATSLEIMNKKTSIVFIDELISELCTRRDALEEELAHEGC